jgi:putative transposase
MKGQAGWGTLAMRQPGQVRPAWLSGWPVHEPSDWTALVNRPASEAQLAALRRSVVRQRPFGSGGWVRQTAAALGLETTLRDPGRPRKADAPLAQPGLFDRVE